MEYVIYCDESVSKGRYFSDFYGGVLVRSRDFDSIKEALELKKKELNLLGEIKWNKITGNYLEKYIDIIRLFFSFIKEDRVKVRIMFRQNAEVPQNLTKEQKDRGYELLYYQFVKHAFGLKYHYPVDGDTYLRLYFDRLPVSNEQKEDFKTHIYGLQGLHDFSNKKLKIRMDDITEIDSHRHVIQQCMDIILGSIAFKLNDMNLEKPEGAMVRGKKTIAKEKVYKFILQEIRSVLDDPNFNIGITTPANNPIQFWEMSYRHWKFIPANIKIDKTKYKNKTPL